MQSTGVRSSSSALAARAATTGWRRSSSWRGCLHAHGRRVRRRADRPNPAPVCHRARELRSSWHTGTSSDSGARRSADLLPASTAPRAGAQGSAWPRLRASSMIARRGGRGGHAVSVRADPALLKFEDRGQATELSMRPDCRAQAFRNSNSNQYTASHKHTQPDQRPPTIGTQRTSWLAHSRYSHSTQSSVSGAP